MKTQRQLLGDAGEQAAAEFLTAHGQMILDRNWRCPAGELDLVIRARCGAISVVEVKTRTTTAYGTGFEAVGAAKYRRLTRLALLWARAHQVYLPRVRVDVIEVTPGTDGRLECTWHRDVCS